MSDERFKLVLKAEPGGDVPAAIRLRRLLKYSLRVCKLRCVRLEPVDDTTANQTADLIARADTGLTSHAARRSGPSQGA